MSPKPIRKGANVSIKCTKKAFSGWDPPEPVGGVYSALSAALPHP